MQWTQTAAGHPTVSVIVPARNEEASLRACLESLLAPAGVPFEVIVVDDQSTDRTREIALSFPGVRVIEASPLPAGWTGKNNAVTCGARVAQGEWLLFTDADTVHLPGSLARSLNEARLHGAALLSYSPEQVVVSIWEKSVMPVIFAELASIYRPSQVSDPNSAVAAANGQYILITRVVYDAVGGHAAIAGSLLEDVALARAVKRSGRKIFFCYGGDSVRTRMYRSSAQLVEGWTKNLALLFPSPVFLALWRLLEFAVILASLTLLVLAVVQKSPVYAALCLIPPALTLMRVSRAHFSWDANLLGLFGLPLFSYLLLRSKWAYANGSVAWKGRSYSPPPMTKATPASRSVVSETSPNPQLRTGN